MSLTSDSKQIGDVEPSPQEKAAAAAELEEMMKEAKVGGILTPVIVLGGYLRSLTQAPLTLVESEPWPGHGYTVKAYPNPVDGVIRFFAQVCLTDAGIMSAVVYAGKNVAGVECRWLLAWADSKCKGKRVYAECGHKCKFNCINWDVIKDKLNEAGPVALAYDCETNTSVNANLTGVDFPVETQDTLLAIFSG